MSWMWISVFFHISLFFVVVMFWSIADILHSCRQQKLFFWALSATTTTTTISKCILSLEKFSMETLVVLLIVYSYLSPPRIHFLFDARYQMQVRIQITNTTTKIGPIFYCFVCEKKTKCKVVKWLVVRGIQWRFCRCWCCCCCCTSHFIHRPCPK